MAELLIVEDDSAILHTLRESLEQEAFAVCCAPAVREARFASEVPAGVSGTLNFTLCEAQNFTAATPLLHLAKPNFTKFSPFAPDLTQTENNSENAFTLHGCLPVKHLAIFDCRSVYTRRKGLILYAVPNIIQLDKLEFGEQVSCLNCKIKGCFYAPEDRQGYY